MEIPFAIFSEISASMLDNLELIPYADETQFPFCYDDKGFLIEGTVTIGGTWMEDGDGYSNPRESVLTDIWGTLDKVDAAAFDEATGETTIVDTKSTDALCNFLENHLQQFLKTQC